MDTHEIGSWLYVTGFFPVYHRNLDMNWIAWLDHIGPLNSAIHGIRVASIIAFSVLCVFSVSYKFSNSSPA